MASTSGIGNLMRKTQRYWYEDGFFDIGFGAFMLAIGLLFVVQALTPPGSPLWLIWGLGGPLLLVGGGYVMSRGVRLMKERITYPRTGYVAYRRAHGKSKVLRLLAVALLAAGVSGGIIVLERNWLNLAVILGFVYAAVFSYIGLRFSLWRYLAMALWSLVLGLGLAQLSLATNPSGAIFHIGTGAVWILAGWLTYRRYIANAPLAQEGNDGAQS